MARLIDLEQLPRFVRHGEPHLDIVITEVRLAHGFVKCAALEEVAMLDEEGDQRGRTGRNNAHVLLGQRPRDGVAIPVQDHRIRLRLGHRPLVGQSLTVHAGRQVGSGFVIEGQRGGAQINRPSRRTGRLRGLEELLEPFERRKENQAEALAKRADDRQARSLHAVIGDIHAQDLTVSGDLPGRDCVQGVGRAKQRFDRVERDPPILKVARFLTVGVLRRDFGHALDHVVQLRSRRFDDRDTRKELSHLGGKVSIGHPDGARSSRRADHG